MKKNKVYSAAELERMLGYDDDDIETEKPLKLQAKPPQLSAEGQHAIALTELAIKILKDRQLDQTIDKLKAEIEGCVAERKAIHLHPMDRDYNRPILAKYDALTEKKKKLEAELKRVQTESQLKAQKKAQFLKNSFGTDADFERLWMTKLRDEALLEAASCKSSAAFHPSFAGAWE